MQLVGGNLLQDLDNRANFNDKGERDIFTAFVRTWRADGTEPVFSVSAEELPVHAYVSQKEVGRIRLSFQSQQRQSILWFKERS